MQFPLLSQNDVSFESDMSDPRLLNGVNGSSTSNPNPTNKRRDLMLIAGLLYHPEMGLILFECGSVEKIESVGSRCPLRCYFNLADERIF